MQLMAIIQNCLYRIIFWNKFIYSIWYNILFDTNITKSQNRKISNKSYLFLIKINCYFYDNMYLLYLWFKNLHLFLLNHNFGSIYISSISFLNFSFIIFLFSFRVGVSIPLSIENYIGMILNRIILWARDIAF